MSYLPLILFGVLLNAAAQLFLKEGLRRILIICVGVYFVTKS